MNELSIEKSPYLLQHKDNLVWWKAWNERTFRTAMQENKLVFLSIGYSTCHWCHVMEHETFVDPEVAKILNGSFVSVKVDREEHPDVDQIYMDALHVMGQRGGWPLNLFLTPDLKPFYGGTYFQKKNFLSLLENVRAIWKAEPDKIRDSSRQLVEIVQKQTEMYRATQPIPEELYKKFTANQKLQFDTTYSGFGGAPKFPPHTQLSLLLRQYKVTGDIELLKMVEQTLQAMACGGLYDHIGGGFTRYSVDERWEIPHFEKMLYVNALAVVNYLESYQATQNSEYADVARDLLSYLMREMLSTGGGFFSAEDADSEGVEGKFYIWSLKELREHLTADELAFVEENFGVTEAGNFEGENHLNIKDKSFQEVHRNPIFKTVREKLFAIREQRVRPLLDDKQLTSWNALAISAFARAARILNEPKFLKVAVDCANFVHSTLMKDEALLRRYRAGQSQFEGTLEDYAYFVQALIELYQSTFEEDWLVRARDLQKKQIDLFYDRDGGGFFFTSAKEKNLILRKKDFDDNALPNANAISAKNLIQLGLYFEDLEWKRLAEETLSCAGHISEHAPAAFAEVLCTNLLLGKKSYQIVAIGKNNFAGLDKVFRRFEPFALVAAADTASQLPLVKSKLSTPGFYICRWGACEAPIGELTP